MRTTMIKVKDINVLCCAYGDKNFAGALIVNYCPMCGKDLRREQNDRNGITPQSL